MCNDVALLGMGSHDGLAAVVDQGIVNGKDAVGVVAGFRVARSQPKAVVERRRIWWTGRLDSQREAIIRGDRLPY